MLDTVEYVREWEVVNEFCILLCLCIFTFALSIKLSLFQPLSVLTFTPHILSPIQWGQGVTQKLSGA